MNNKQYPPYAKIPNFSDYLFLDRGHIYCRSKDVIVNTPDQKEVTLKNDQGSPDNRTRKKWIWTAFEFPPTHHTIGFKDGDENNCSIYNLYFETRSETTKNSACVPSQCKGVQYYYNFPWSLTFVAAKSKAEAKQVSNLSDSQFRKLFGAPGPKEIEYAPGRILRKSYSKPFYFGYKNGKFSNEVKIDYEFDVQRSILDEDVESQANGERKILFPYEYKEEK